jgi:hypothetical protein
MALLTPISLGSLLSVLAVFLLLDFWSPPYSVQVLLLSLAAFLPLALYEICVLKSYKNSGLDFSLWSKRRFCFPRVLKKYAVFIIPILIFFFILSVVPYFQLIKFIPLKDTLLMAAPFLFAASFLYFLCIDRIQSQTDDHYVLSYIYLSSFCRRQDFRSEFFHLCRVFAVKFFFVPLMVLSLLTLLIELDRLSLSAADIVSDIRILVSFLLLILLLVDVLYALVGYMFANRLLGTEERSMQTNLLAWFLTLICYGSLWVFIQDFLYSAERAKDWTEFFADFSVWQVLWGLGLVLSTGFYVVATLNLGLRFSNLSHRGIVTTGLYSFTKHPAYIFKNIYLWFLMCPVLFEANILDQIQGVLFLIFIHLIYILRAKTEEEHLSQDKEYRAYRTAMEHKSLLRRFRF